MSPRKPDRLSLALSRPPVVIEGVEPFVEYGAFPAKAVVGMPLTVRADVFAHGHEEVRAFLRFRRVGGRSWTSVAMAPLGNDRFSASFIAHELGRYELVVLGEIDQLANWRRDAGRRLEDGRFDANDLARGALLLAATADRLSPIDRAGATTLRELAEALSIDANPADLSKVLVALDEEPALTDRVPPGGLVSTGPPMPIVVARSIAACSAWYECFPRSTSPDPRRSGTLSDLISRLDYIAELGFDVLYLPPIHPIGTTNRKGKNNTAVANASDVGSPWAIGSPVGGHTAIAPELGDLDDFAALVNEAAGRGVEIALDLAFQCSPDHPWVAEHPAWFFHRADGTIAYAENPPKRYEDVYPLDFETVDRSALYHAFLGVVMFWVDHGVRLFRVDNPHTKPFAFFEWLIEEVRRRDPGVVFLSEAFTRPKVMHRLAKVGFDQSYTYFTWRDSKQELIDYFNELAHGPGAAYFRPNVWPNTPDILAKSLQRGGRPSFVTRLMLAACCSANYGIYGPVFELLVDAPAAPGSEEYAHSEKYEVRHFDLGSPRSIADIVTRINAARRDHPALQRNDTLVFHHTDNDQLLCWSKSDPASGDRMLCIVNLDPTRAQSGDVNLDLWQLQLGETEAFVVEDLLEDVSYSWRGRSNFVLLDPARNNAHLFALRAVPIGRQ